MRVTAEGNVQHSQPAVSLRCTSVCASITLTCRFSLSLMPCSYYQEFSAYAHGLDASQPLLPTLLEVLEGRTAPPAATATATTSNDSAPAPAATDSPSISWDIGVADGSNNDAGQSSAPAGISWDLDLGAAGDAGDAGAAGAGGGISWDVEVEPQAEAGGTDGGGISWDIDITADTSNDAAGGVNWDIGMEDAGAAAAAPVEIKWDIDVAAGEAGAGQDTAAAGPSSDAAAAESSSPAVTGDAAVLLRLEQDAEYRNLLTDDLLELHAFLQQVRGARIIVPQNHSNRSQHVSACGLLLARACVWSTPTQAVDRVT